MEVFMEIEITLFPLCPALKGGGKSLITTKPLILIPTLLGPGQGIKIFRDLDLKKVTPE